MRKICIKFSLFEVIESYVRFDLYQRTYPAGASTLSALPTHLPSERTYFLDDPLFCFWEGSFVVDFDVEKEQVSGQFSCKAK